MKHSVGSQPGRMNTARDRVPTGPRRCSGALRARPWLRPQRVSTNESPRTVGVRGLWIMHGMLNLILLRSARGAERGEEPGEVGGGHLPVAVEVAAGVRRHRV